MSPPLSFLSIKNFERYQHYKHRRPIWIKLYRALLDDETFTSMSINSRHHYMSLLLIASDTDNRIPDDGHLLQYMLKIGEEPDLSELKRQGFVIPYHGNASESASRTASETASKNAPSEKRRVEQSRVEQSQIRTLLRKRVRFLRQFQNLRRFRNWPTPPGSNP